MLIVFDNCEHALDEVALLAESLLRGASNIHLLATSRQPLRGEGEFLYHLAALEVPPRDSTRVFGRRAFYRASGRFAGFVQLTGDNVATVIDICQRLDGIPLAIELAAARVDLFGVDGLASQLNDCFSILTKGRGPHCPAPNLTRDARLEF